MRSRLSSPAIVMSKRGMGEVRNEEFRVPVEANPNGLVDPSSHLQRQSLDLESDQSYLDSRLLQRAHIGFCGAAVRDHFLERCGRSDQRQAAATEFARITHGHGFLGDLYHHTIDFRLQKIWRAQPKMDVESVDAEKQ